MINLYLGDSLEAMRAMDDNTYDIAIVDPPYGINIVKHMVHDQQSTSMYGQSWQNNNNALWDSEIPPPEYFTELRRVSRNQIIWGGNYFIDYLSNTKCMLVWNKHNGGNPLADCELAWTSYNKPVRMFTMHHFAAGYGKKIHPTQKPVALYQWILDLYAKPGDRILDTHLGSGSIAIACHNAGYALDAWEISPEYHANAVARFNEHTRQLRLF